MDIIADSAGDARQQAADSGLRLIMVSGSRLVPRHASGRHGDDLPGGSHYD